MTTRLRYFYILWLFAGSLITFWSIAALSSPGDRTPIGHIVQIAIGVFMVASGGYGSLYPQKANIPAVNLFSAVVGFVLAAAVFFSLLHFYGNTGFFATGDSMTGLGATAFLLIGSVCLLFYSHFLRNNGQS